MSASPSRRRAIVAAALLVLAGGSGAVWYFTRPTPAPTVAPPEVKAAGYPGVEIVGNRFVLACDATMEMTGRAVDVKDGKLEAAPLAQTGSGRRPLPAS